ncbi:MAG: hypothetical protein ACRC2T_11540, partial [Thermoguttaceae bacterium]
MNRIIISIALSVALVFSIIPLSLAADILIPAKNMSEQSEGVNRADANWSDLAVLHGQIGFMQWVFEIEKPGEYYIHFLYASGESRPAMLSIDGKVHEDSEFILKKPTGGFHAPNLDWETIGPVDLSAAKHEIRISAQNYLPHIRGFVVSTEKNPPSEDPFDAENRKLQAELFAKQKSEITATQKKVLKILNNGNDVTGSSSGKTVDSIVFIRRKAFQSSHYYTDFIDGCVHFGSDLCVLNLKDGTVRELAPSLKEGMIGRCNLSFDGKKVIFDYKAKIGEGFRIWEVGIDGTGLRQLTFPPDDEAARIAKYRQTWHPLYYHHTDDMHPTYLPDGGICFASTRCEFGILCDGPDILTTSVLYRADADGKNIEKLSNNSVSESAPSVMNDGKILYTRWEYVDNGSVTNKGLWSMRPDGTGSAEVYGANIVFPSVFNVGRAVPNSNDLFVCIGAPHMPLGVGTVMKVDTRLDRRGGEPVTYITPEVDVRH